MDVEERERDNGGDWGRVGDMQDIYTGVDGWEEGRGGDTIKGETGNHDGVR